MSDFPVWSYEQILISDSFMINITLCETPHGAFTSRVIVLHCNEDTKSNVLIINVPNQEHYLPSWWSYFIMIIFVPFTEFDIWVCLLCDPRHRVPVRHNPHQPPRFLLSYICLLLLVVRAKVPHQTDRESYQAVSFLVLYVGSGLCLRIKIKFAIKLSFRS